MMRLNYLFTIISNRKFLRYILIADMVLVLFFISRVLVNELGTGLMLPLFALGGTMLLLLHNHTVAHKAIATLEKLWPDIPKKPWFHIFIILYHYRIHLIAGFLFYMVILYSILIAMII